MILVFGLKFWLKVTTNPSYIRYMLVKNEPEWGQGKKIYGPDKDFIQT